MMVMMVMMVMNTKLIHTTHSLERWNERFSFLDIESEWDSALKATKRQRDVIKYHSCRASKLNKGVDYFISKNYVVFVVGEDMTLITVFPYIKRCNKKTRQMCKTNNSRYKNQKRIDNES